MGKGLDNYYLILGLDFAKPESDEQVINQRIKEKVKFWNANSDKGTMQQKYRQYKSQVMDIGKVMKTENLRNVEAKDAMMFVNGILKEEKKFFAGKKEIEETAAKAIMEKCGLWPEMFEKLSGLRIVPDPEIGETEKMDPNPKPDKAAKFNKYTSDLNILHKTNLYDFLADSTANIIGLQELEGEELIKNYSNPLKERVNKGRTEEDVSTKTLCAACEEVFDPQNIQLRINYDKYLIWQKIDQVMNRIVKYSGAKKMLDGQQPELFIDELTQILRNRDDAVKRFRQICAYKDIKSSTEMEQQSDMSGKVLCGHCYRMSDVSHGERKCTFCGKDLYIICPQCEEEALSSSQACGHCGYVFENTKKAGTYCDIAEQALVNMDFDKARSALARAAELAGKSGRIKELQKKLEDQEGILAREAAQLDMLVKKKSFYKAAEILCSLQRKAPTAKIANAVLIETSVKEAERLYKAAVKETSEQMLIEACSQIVSVCADYPGVEPLMLKYRPQPPSNLKIVCDGSSCSNMLTWEKSPSAGTISYRILRKANAAPASMEDESAEEIGTAGDTEFVDVTPKPGVN